MSAQAQLALFEKQLINESDPARRASIQAKISYLKKSSKAVTEPVEARAFSSGKVDFYAFLSQPVTPVTRSCKGGTSTVTFFEYKNVMAILPFTLTSPSTHGIQISEDLHAITMSNGEQDFRLTTTTMFTLKFTGINPANKNGGWHKLIGVRPPSSKSQTRDNGLIWLQLSADKAIPWNDAPSMAQLYDVYTRFHCSVRNDTIYPLPDHLKVDMKELAERANALAAASSSSSSDATGKASIIDCENAARALLTRLAIQLGPKQLNSSALDPCHMADFLFYSRQLVVPLRPSLTSDISLDETSTGMFISSVLTLFGPQCLTDNDKPKKIVPSSANPWEHQCAARLGIRVDRTMPDGQSLTSISVSAFMADGQRFFSQVMGLYSHDSIIALTSTPVYDVALQERVPRASIFPMVATGPLSTYRTLNSNTSEAALGSDGEKISSLDFTPFGGASDLITGIYNSCILIDFKTAAELMKGICKTPVDPKIGLSIDAAIKRDAADTNPFRWLTDHCKLHELTNGAVISPTQSINLYQEMGGNISKGISEESAAKNYHLFLMCNLVFIDLQQEIEYRTMVADYFNTPMRDPRKKTLVKSLLTAAANFGPQILASTNVYAPKTVFEFPKDVSSFAFEIFAVATEMADPELRHKHTSFNHIEFSEASIQAAREAVAKINGKKIDASISNVVSSEELALLEQFDKPTATPPPSPASSSSSKKRPAPKSEFDDDDDLDDVPEKPEPAKKPRSLKKK